MDDTIKLLKKLLQNNLFVFFVLLFLITICYSNSLFNEYVSDDWGIFQVSYAPQAIFPNPGALFSNYPEQIYRAILINSKLTSPIFFRLPNIMAHLGSSYLIFLIIKKLSNRKTAILTSLLFAVHPVLIESITWISGGSYAKYTFFFLLSFWLYLKSNKKGIYYILAILSFYLAIIHNEKATPLFLIYPLFEICFENFKKNWKKSFPFFIISFIKVMLLIPTTSAYQNTIQTQFYQEIVTQNPFYQLPIAITEYLKLIFWPDQLTLYHTELKFTQTEFIIRLCILIFYVMFLFWSFLKNKYIFFWLSFFMLALAITLNPWGYGWVVAERYVYLGTLGVLAIIAYLLNQIGKNKKMLLPVLIIFSIMIILLCLRTVTRNLDWLNGDNLWLAAARTSPNSPQNHNNLGDLYGRHGNYQKALEEFQTAIVLNPKYADAYHNLANTYEQIGDHNNAIKNYQLAIKYNPHLWQSSQNLAVLYYNNNEKNMAQDVLKTYLKLDPGNSTIQNLYQKIND